LLKLLFGMRRLGVLGSGGTSPEGAAIAGRLRFRRSAGVGISFFYIFSFLSFGLVVLFATTVVAILYRLVAILIYRGETLFRGT
jgi:hypothetical protein